MAADLPDDIRRMIELHDLVEFRRRAGPIEREVWVKASRAIFDPGPRDVCWVCRRFGSITEAHHVIPLTQQYDRGFRYPNNEHVWLCPNHHTMAHLYILSDDRSTKLPAIRARHETIAALNSDLSEDEFQKMIELMRLATRSPE